LESVARELADAGARDGVALHTCAAKDGGALESLRERGFACGVLHPLQTIPVGSDAGVLLGIAFGISGDAAAVDLARRIVSALDGETLVIAPGVTAAYHAAAVMASNNLVAALDAARHLMTKAGVPAGSALGALAPLARAAVSNALALGPERALTGPIARGDTATVRAHVEGISGADQSVRDLYCAAGLQALAIASRNGLAEGAAAEIAEILQPKVIAPKLCQNE
jgi:predicted short-subunit dehydrogenase-like oxidoreductase (DUF2520 family)